MASGKPKANRVYAAPDVDKTELMDFCNEFRKFWKNAAASVKINQSSNDWPLWSRRQDMTKRCTKMPA